MKVRGFSLVVILAIGAAAGAIGATVLTVSQAARVRAAHATQGERAAAIADAGFARARAYVAGLVTAGGDFDRVLDPLAEANCAGLPASAPTAPMGSHVRRPVFTDGDQISYQGHSYTRVAYDGGAYLIRFEDDNDDIRPEMSWQRHTGNSTGPTGCAEGPATLGGADNPVRDRNQAIQIVVLGIAPGLDPERAVHRHVLRRTEVLGGTAQVAGIQVRGDIDLSGSARLHACSPIGSLAVDGEIDAQGASNGCACGESRAGAVLGNWSHCTADVSRCGGVACATGTLDTPGPTVAEVPDLDDPAGADSFFDWSSRCIFRVDISEGGLWFWDATAPRGPGGALCSTNDGSGFGIPDIEPSDPSEYKACWTPILVNNFVLPVFPGEGGVGGRWTPTNTAQTVTLASVNTALSAGGYPTFTGGGSLTKPAWGTECLVTHPSITTAPLMRGCTECDGTHVAMAPMSGTYWFSGDTLEELQAIPAGTYYYDSGVALSGAEADMDAPLPGTPPDHADFVIEQWPLMTIAVKGVVDLQSRTILGFGAGTKPDRALPSIISNGDIEFSGAAEKFIGGSVWSTTSWSWNGGSKNYFYGEVHLTQDWDIGGSGDFYWRYNHALSAATHGGANTPPTLHSSLD